MSSGFLYNKTVSSKNFCGDSSFYGTCSLRKPYFCDEGFLVEKATICGCPSSLMKEGNLCSSKYQEGVKYVNLNYYFLGLEQNFTFPVYSKMRDYLSAQSRSIEYVDGEKPFRVDFKLKKINEDNQRYFLLPLVTEIQNLAKDKEDQFRIAVSLVQNIPYGKSNETIVLDNGGKVDYSRYPYEILYEGQGICGEKAELLAFLLREIGYGVVLYYYAEENHEALGVKCPSKYGLGGSDYCFIETSGPALVTDSDLSYAGGYRLESAPQTMLLSEGISLQENFEEFREAEEYMRIRERLSFASKDDLAKFNSIKTKYGLVEKYYLN